MDQLNAMRVFRCVAESGSFSAAAQTLGLSNGAVSKQVSALEKHFDVQLIQRTTRRFNLTETGRSYLERCARILDDIDETEASLIRLQAVPKGTLRVNAPVSYSILHLGPLFAAFLQSYPEIRLDLSLSDRFVDLLDEGLDVVLRVSEELEDSTLIARRLATIDHVICATPGYLERAGIPRSPDDLQHHECLIYAPATPMSEWHFDGPGGPCAVRVSGRFQSNNSVPLRDALVAGFGIARIPRVYVEALLQTGDLVQVTMHRYRIQPSTLYAVYPHSRHLSAKVRAFVDFMVAKLGSSAAIE